MLKRIKHGTTVMVGSMKHDKDVARCFDPNVEVGKAQLKEFRDHIRNFIDDADKLIHTLPRVFKAASEFSGLTEKCFETFPEEDRVIAAHLSQLTRDITLFVTEKTGAIANDEVLRPLQDLLRMLEDLSNVAKRQADSFLILEQNKAKLEGLQKDAEKNAPQIAQYAEKVTARTQEVNDLEREFVERMNAAWDNRFNVLRGPLHALLAIVTDTGEALLTAATPIIEVLGEEALAAEYPITVPEPKKKK
jgi:hypothetical protein